MGSLTFLLLSLCSAIPFSSLYMLPLYSLYKLRHVCHCGDLGNMRWCLIVERAVFRISASFLLLNFLCLRCEIVLSVKWSFPLGNLLKLRTRSQRKAPWKFYMEQRFLWEWMQVLRCKTLIFLHRWSTHVMTSGWDRILEWSLTSDTVGGTWLSSDLLLLTISLFSGELWPCAERQQSPERIQWARLWSLCFYRHIIQLTTLVSNGGLLRRDTCLKRAQGTRYICAKLEQKHLQCFSNQNKVQIK